MFMVSAEELGAALVWALLSASATAWRSLLV
jgi:hypothetical protein